MYVSRIPVTLRFAGFVAAALMASSASAQEIDWRVTPYLWAAGIDGEIGLGNLRRDVDVDFSDLLDVLSGAALLHVEGESDGNIGFGDLVWMELTPHDIATIE